MTDKQKVSNESPLCWVRPVTTVPDLGGFQVCREGEGFPVWAHPNGGYAPVSAKQVALPQCPFPCGWSGLYKIAVQDAAYLAKVQWPEDEEGVNVPRATAMRSMDYLIQVCRTLLTAAPVAAQAQQPVSGAGLREALRHLIRGYVNLMENGRDRILFLGGQCDPVDVMEASDPWLKSARAALAQQDDRSDWCRLSGCSHKAAGSPAWNNKQNAEKVDAEIDRAFNAVRKKLVALPRYSFLADGSGGVRCVKDSTGAWIPFDKAHALFDPVSVDAARKEQE